MSQFSNAKYKISKIDQAQKKAQSDLNNENIISINIRPETYIKRGVEIPLLTDYLILLEPLRTGQFVSFFSLYNITENIYNATIIVNNLTDSLINFFKVNAIFHSTGAYENINLFSSVPQFPSDHRIIFRHLWEKIDDSNYKLHFYIHQETKYSTIGSSDSRTRPAIPIYLNLSLIYINPISNITFLGS